MKSAVFASIREGAGKTSILAGIMSALNDQYGYVKPIGDRLIYKRKRNRDYDSTLIIDLFGLKDDAESITLGFDHSKLRYMYDEESLEKALNEMVEQAGKDRKGVFIEAGRDIFYGSSVKLDPVSLARYTQSPLVLVVSGEDESVMDLLSFIKKNIDLQGVSDVSVIINKVYDIDDFESIYLRDIEKMGFKVLGILPYKEQLTQYTVSYVADRLYAKVIAGENGLDQVVKAVFVGAMSTGESLRNPMFNKQSKFLITSGDRNDMILSALESDTVGILLTNNILPPSNIISLANEKNIPMLLVAMDTYNAARHIGRMETLLTSDNKDMLRLLKQLASKYIKTDKIFG